jgi:hypothetical protein
MAKPQWEFMRLHEKIAQEGPGLNERHADYLNKIKVKTSVPATAPNAKIAKLITTFATPEEFNESHLNPNHILKASRGSGYLVDLAKVKTVEEARNCMQLWIKELRNKDKPVEFLIEEKIVDAVFGSTGTATDYKFFCFNGEPHFFLCRFNGNRNFYDLNYNPIKLQGESQLPQIDLAPMLEIARQLSAPFPFVRIDLYHGADGVYFGEYTFHVNLGHREFNDDLERKFGKLWTVV